MNNNDDQLRQVLMAIAKTDDPETALQSLLSYDITQIGTVKDMITEMRKRELDNRRKKVEKEYKYAINYSKAKDSVG